MAKLQRPLRPDVPHAKHAQDKPGPPITEEDADRLKAGKKVHTAGPGAGKGTVKSPKEVVSPGARKGADAVKSPKKVVAPGAKKASSPAESQRVAGTSGAKQNPPDVAERVKRGEVASVVFKVWIRGGDGQFIVLAVNVIPEEMVERLKLYSSDEWTEEERCAVHVLDITSEGGNTVSLFAKLKKGATSDFDSYLQSVM